MSRLDRMLAIAGVGANEGVLIHKPSNIFYLSGYTGEGLLAVGEGFQAIVTDFRYTEQAERQAPGWQVLMVEKGVSHAMLAAKVFAEHRILLFGNESQTVGPEDAPMAVHLAMLGAGIVLLEGIRLAETKDGVYFLNAAPLNLGGADGAPCRAWLIPADDLRV